MYGTSCGAERVKKKKKKYTFTAKKIFTFLYSWSKVRLTIVFPMAEEIRLRLSAVPPTTWPIKLCAPSAIPSANSSGPSSIPYKERIYIPLRSVFRDNFCKVFFFFLRCSLLFFPWLQSSQVHKWAFNFLKYIWNFYSKNNFKILTCWLRKHFRFLPEISQNLRDPRVA